MEINQYSILSIILIVLASSLIVTTICRKLQLPPIIGYLVVGVFVGPSGIGLIPATDAIQHLAEFGVVFLMFTIGLEFSLAKLFAMKRIVLGLGGLQVIITTLITLEIAILFGMTTTAAIVLGGIVAMSSTAVVVKQLQEQLEINSIHGQNAIGILLFQDLAVIAFIILIASFGYDGSPNILIPLGLALIKAIIVMAIIFLAGRWVLRPLFQIIALTKSLELFTLAILLVTLGGAWMTEFMGLSLALGAFLAGMMLGETEFRHQIEVEIRPFRDVLMGLFFISIGMLLNIKVLPEIWPGVLALLCAIIFAKTLIISVLSRLFGYNSSISLRTGLILAQGGEFGFALLTLALSSNLIAEKHGQIILSALFFSLAITPFLIRCNQKISQWLLPKAAKISELAMQESIKETASGLNDHIIICGYGRVGQNIARILETEGFEFIALDMDPNKIQSAQLACDRVNYGDSANIHILEAAGLNRAKALIISYDDLPATFKILPQVRKQYPKLPILVRTRDDSELEYLQNLGATEVIPETLEASLMLAFHTLILMDVSAARALRQVRKIRQNRYELLHRVFPSNELENLDAETDSTKEKLYVVTLPENASAIGKSIKDLNLSKYDITVTAVCRDGIRCPDPDPNLILKDRDVLVIYGSSHDCETCEHIILEG